MSRWFRHYAGMMRDDKLVSVAIKAKQPVERVVWVWGAILESAAELDDDGLFRFDTAEAAYFLRADEGDLRAVVDALAGAGRLAGDRVVKWSARQFKSDRSAERQARYRDAKRQQIRERDDEPPSDDGVVTSLSRYGDAPETETETETELETETDKTPPPVSVAGARDLFDEVWGAFPRNPTSIEAKAEAAYSATKVSERPALLAAAQRYAVWFAEDCGRRKRTAEVGLAFVPHLSTWIETGSWKSADALPVKSPGKALPVTPMVRIDRTLEPGVWAACERIQGRKAPTSDVSWAFPLETVAKARAELDQSQAVH